MWTLGDWGLLLLGVGIGIGLTALLFIKPLYRGDQDTDSMDPQN